MKLNIIAAAVAAAFLSLGAVAQDKQDQDKSSAPSATQEKKPDSTTSGGSAAAGGGRGKGGMASGGSHDPETIKQVQTKLKEQGHDVGQADGIMGPKTQKGLKDFQAAKGLKGDGQLNQETLSALGVNGGASAAGGGSPAKKAEGSSGKKQ